ncbi:DUF397 domain-containing protein [Trebonia sp.]|uniref:DUF397 domain-containing protein n=1 Tax=Trebonia sp. TaxID=2767075 RepID=UPI002613411E|nr:DUF397 domain-containing protein [Trebonia sp.]
MKGRFADDSAQKRTGSSLSTESGSCVEVARLSRGEIRVRRREPRGACLRFTPEEWDAFMISVRKGEFDHVEPGSPTRADEAHSVPSQAATGSDRQLPGPSGFWDRVLNDENRTLRLGYLIRQAALVIALIVIVLYLLIYRAPLDIKVGISSCSAMLILIGRLLGAYRRGKKSRR